MSAARDSWTGPHGRALSFAGVPSRGRARARAHNPSFRYLYFRSAHPPFLRRVRIDVSVSCSPPFVTSLYFESPDGASDRTSTRRGSWRDGEERNTPRARHGNRNIIKFRRQRAGLARTPRSRALYHNTTPLGTKGQRQRALAARTPTPTRRTARSACTADRSAQTAQVERRGRSPTRRQSLTALTSSLMLYSVSLRARRGHATVHRRSGRRCTHASVSLDPAYLPASDWGSGRI